MFKTATVDRASAKSNNSSPFHRETEQEAFIQPKLNIGKPNDKYEVEADMVADKVVNKTTHNGDSSFFSPATTIQKRDIQKQEDPEEIQEKPIAQTITPLVQLEPAEEEPVQEKTDDTIQKQEEEEDVQMMPDEEVQAMEEEEDVQTKMERPRDSVATIANRIREGRRNGRPLGTETRASMERGFGADFSDVQIHTDSIAASMNQDLGARAFTNNNDIFFNEGQFNPQSRDGQTLLAHELTHTIQQGASTAVQEIEPSLETPLADVLTEQEIDLPSTSTTESADQGQEVLDVVESDTSVELEEETTVEDGQENPESTEELLEGEVEEGAEPEEAFPMSPEEDPAFNELETRVEGASEDQQTTNPAEQETQAAQSAAAVPSNERMGGAQANQVAVMDEQEPVEFDAEAFKAKLMERIESMQLPEDQEEATEFEDNNNIQEISDAASADASQAQETTAGPISEATAAAPNVEAVPEREVTALPEAPIGQRPSSVNANSAMPNARPESQVSQPLQENMQEVDQEMIDNEVTEEQLARSNEPEFASALDSRSEARANTEEAPAQFREGETQSLNGSQQQAENASQGTLEGMHGDRSNILNEVVGQQTETGTQNTTERERISTEINGIYETAKTDVETILEDLDAKVTEKFDAAAKKAKKIFEDYVEQEMDKYKARRYSGISGGIQWGIDKFMGLPDEVNQFFVDGRLEYIKEMDKALTVISNYIGTRLTEAKNRIELGKQEVTDYVEALPENLQSIGEEASENIQDKFDQLTDDVNSKQDELIDSLAQQYNDSLSEVDTRIEEMQAANRGLIDMALDAVKGVIETIRKLKQLVSDLLSEIQSSMAIIMADPIAFVSNLFDGVKQGFDNFKSNIETHLMAGFVQWLTGALGPMGITIPEDVFSLKGIFSLVMQVLGLTWDYMREKAVKLLGEPVVRAMEFGLEMFTIIREKGVEGIWEYIKEQFTDLKETIIDSIKDLLITQVIQAGIRWLLSLLIPGAGFIKAIMAIKDFIVFFVESALMLIPALIEAIRAMASGSMALVATAIERGLALLVPLVIKLFARIIGLGGLVKKVQKIIKKIRRRIDRAINKLILKAKKAFRKLVRKGKAAVAGVLEWWKVKKRFTSEGETHNVFLKGNAGAVQLWVASEEMPFGTLLTSKQSEINEMTNETSKTRKQEAHDGATRIYNNDILRITNLLSSNIDEARKNELQAELNSKFDEIVPFLVTLGVGGSSGRRPNTMVRIGNSGGRASFSEADPLTKNESRKPPRVTADPLGWTSHVKTITNYSSNYVRLHLLHFDLGGPGNDTGNVTPGRKTENQNMYNQAESNAVDLVHNQNRVLWYRAEVTGYRSEISFTDFAEAIRVSYGFKEKNESGEWVRIGEVLYDNVFSVSKPDNIGANNPIPSINDVPFNYWDSELKNIPGRPSRSLYREWVTNRGSSNFTTWSQFLSSAAFINADAKYNGSLENWFKAAVAANKLRAF